ncbi:MAG TPA: peptide ABC transporter substrate-binding protein [Micropepsaceae bacterium]|nr:peptide ABC transporter substrate-binding protein [Micropepsaceae bacterium]
MNFIRRAAMAAMIVLATSASAFAATLHRGNMNEPDTLDPHRATGSWESNILGDMFLGLTTEAADGTPIPGAAESWTVSDDGLVYTFTLRADGVWSDGTPVVADDFVYSIRRLMDPTLAAEYASILYVIKNAYGVNAGTLQPEELGVRAIDARTVEITLEHPAAYLPQLLMHQTAYPVPRHVVEQFGADWTDPAHMVSNGAYTLAAWTPNDHVRIVKNPRFHDAANVSIDTVIFYPTDDGTAAIKRFRAGELDMNAGFPSQQVPWLRDNIPAETRFATFINTRFITFLTERAPFDDVRVRRALSMAIDRETIAAKIMGAGELPAYSLVPPGMSNYVAGAQHDFAATPLAQRQEQARALLAEAGFGAGNPLRFRYNYIADPDSRRVAAALQEMWRAIGAEAELVASEKKVHYNTVRARDYEVGEGNWIADFDDPVNFLFLAQPSSGDMNASRWPDMAFEEMIARANQMTDAGARALVLRDAEQYMLDAAPLTPLYFGVSRNLVGLHVKGYVDNITNVHRSRFLSIDEGARVSRGEGAAASEGEAVAEADGEGGFFATIWGWIVSAWNWFLGLLCSWFGVACPQS